MTPMQYVVLAIAVVCILWALDVAEDRREAGCYRSTWRQRRAWATERKLLNPNLKGLK